MNLKCQSPGKLLAEKGFLAFYAFETARDLLLGKVPGVLKILTDADLFQLAKLFPDGVHEKRGGLHLRCEEDGSAVRIIVTECPMERLVRLPGDFEHKKQVLMSATSDALFNVNCFFYDIQAGIFRDPLDQYATLKKGEVATLEHPDDAASRVSSLALKTAKVIAETGFAVDERLKSYLASEGASPELRQIDEEVLDDFRAICLSGRAFEAFSLLDDWGVLEALLPELTALKDVYQDKDHHPEGNGFRHTLRCLKCVKKPNLNLIVAILLHDTGKAATVNNVKKRRTFPNHSAVSTTLARRVLSRLRFEARDAEEVLFLVQNHMILDAVKRLPEVRLRNVFDSPFFPNLLELYRADLQSGYHQIDNYYHAARMYKEYLRADQLKRQGVYA